MVHEPYCYVIDLVSKAAFGTLNREMYLIFSNSAVSFLNAFTFLSILSISQIKIDRLLKNRLEVDLRIQLFR